MSEKPRKVVSLAEHRRKHLALVGFHSRLDGPVNAGWYDAWVETDGSIVVRFDAERLVFCESGLRFGKANEQPFVVRGKAYELRIAPLDVPAFQRAMSHVGHVSRRRVEVQRGDHLWRCEPVGDGAFKVTHERDSAIFEPFKCRARDGLVPDGPRQPSGMQAMRPAKVAPKCRACARVVQIGETMYRERRPLALAYRKFGGAELCSGCIKNAPNKGIGEVAS